MACRKRHRKDKVISYLSPTVTRVAASVATQHPKTRPGVSVRDLTQHRDREKCSIRWEQVVSFAFLFFFVLLLVGRAASKQRSLLL